MTIIDSRIDNRLLHGIVTTQWAPKIAPTRIMVIDDEVANSPILKSSMKLGKPTGMAISIITEEIAIDHFKKQMYASQKVFIIVKSPSVIKNLIDQGITVPKLTIGATTVPKPIKPGDLKVHSRAYITKAEIPIYKNLIAAGVKLCAQYVPSDKAISAEKIFINND